MRQGSTQLGSLGTAPRLGLLAGGAVLLILPLYAATAGVFSAQPSWAEEAAAPMPLMEPEKPATEAEQRAALQRRSDWLHRANETAAGRRAAVAQTAAQPGPAKAKKPVVAHQKPVKVIHTRATWYGPGFHGRRTASGERFNQNAMTLASRHLPFGTRVRVVNLKTGKAAIGRVNDRGPFVRGYTADLSKGLASKIGLRGTGAVRLEILPKAKK
jgi:rare lipoprotein A (peptidoglycan hydrolase)